MLEEFAALCSLARLDHHVACKTQTGRLDKAAVLQLQRGMKQLNVSEHLDRQITCKIVECARLERELLC